ERVDDRTRLTAYRTAGALARRSALDHRSRLFDDGLNDELDDGSRSHDPPARHPARARRAARSARARLPDRDRAGPLPGFGHRAASPANAQDAVSGDTYIKWLVEQSMLYQGDLAARRYSGAGEQWRHPYAEPEPRAASALASVWFTSYPPAQITGPGESVLESMGDAELWRVFREIGIEGMHTGPMKLAGGLRGREYTPTVDGNFDRISSEIDPAFGTETQFKTMVRRAADNDAVIIGDIIPGHSG